MPTNKFEQFLSKKISVEVKIWKLLAGIFSIVLVGYAVWEYYWYTQVGLRFIKWHTHLMALSYLWAILFLLLYFIVSKKNIELFKKLLLGLCSIFFVLYSLEAFLLVTGFNKTYLELAGGYYFSPYEPEHESYYHTWPTNSNEHWIEKPEYKHWRPTNSLGYPDNEWKIAKQQDQTRVLTLGDSFTEGDGAEYDSSYVAIIRTMIKNPQNSIEFLNAGICGSDPFFDFKALEDKLIIYQPDVIFQTLSAQDLLTDIIIRGGADRFAENGLKFNSPPWWEPIYAISFISRFYFKYLGYTELLRQKYLTEDETELLNNQIISLFEDYIAFCKTRNIELVIILRPDKDEIINEKYNFDFLKVLQFFSQYDNVKVIDLLEAYLNYIDATDTHVDRYFWIYDGHHNANGYKMMAHCIYNKVGHELNNRTAPK